MKRFSPLVAIAALTLFGCSEAAPPQATENVTAEWSDNEDWRSLPNADLVKGKVIYRTDVTSYVFDDERALDVELLNENLLYVKGAAKTEIDGAKKFDVIWVPDMVWTVEKVSVGPLGTYVEVSRFDMLDFVWGDFEIDTGEAFTRGMMADVGLWTPEAGYLVTPAAAQLMTPEEIMEVSMLPEAQGLRRMAQTSTTNLGTIELTRDFESADDRFKLGLKGTIKFPLTVEGIVKLRAYKEDAVLWWDASFDINTEASSGEYPQCHSGPNRTTRTCIDQLLVKFEPGIESTMEAEMVARLGNFFAWKLDGKKYPIFSMSIPGIPLGPFLKLKPGFVVEPVAEISADTTITLKGSVKGDLRYPLGVEYFGDWRLARAECGQPCISGDCGCQQGANMLPNAQHPRTASVDADASISAAVGTIQGKAGVSFKLTLGIAPSVGVVVIEGITAGMKVLGKGKYQPFRVGGGSSDPCLKLEGKAIPFAGFDAKLKWDVGKRGELMSLGAAEFEIASLSLGTPYENDDFCIDLSPRDRVVLNVTNAQIPSGRMDLTGYEVDAVWVTRPGEDERVIKPSNGTDTSYPPDGRCVDTGNWVGVANISSGFTWNFPEDLKPGDVVHMTRISNDLSGGCKPSGTAELFVSGGGTQRSIGTADNSQNEFTFTLSASDFL